MILQPVIENCVFHGFGDQEEPGRIALFGGGAIETIDESVYELAGGAGSRRGTGGMRTKLGAADLCAAQGIDTIVTNGKDPSVLYRIMQGEKVGTLFVGK